MPVVHERRLDGSERLNKLPLKGGEEKEEVVCCTVMQRVGKTEKVQVHEVPLEYVRYVSWYCSNSATFWSAFQVHALDL